MRNIQALDNEVMRKSILDKHFSDPEILLANLDTVDGFHVSRFVTGNITIESDKLAAIASSISALSQGGAEQLLGQGFDIVTMETLAGNILLIKTSYLTYSCVITLVTTPSLSLATARYIIKRAAQDIAKIVS